jgi:hypothetical protein
MFPRLKTLIDYKLANVKLDDIILNIQNISLMGISLYSLYCCMNYYFGIKYYNSNLYSHSLDINDEKLYTYTRQFDDLFVYVQIYAFIDIFLVKTNDLRLHHLFIFGLSFYGWVTKLHTIHQFACSYPLLKTEVSNIFLILKHYLPANTTIYNINMLLFYIFFMKFRIIDIYFEIFHNNCAFNVYIQNYSPSYIYILLASVYGLFILNIYWFLIINKTLYKMLLKNTQFNTDKMCHYICSYIHYLNIPFTAYFYSYNNQEQNIIYMSGIVVLSVASYMYHYDIYYKICTKLINEYVVEKNINYVYFLNDCLCIHIRFFLAVFTNYYNNPYFYAVTTFCGVFQLGCFYNGVINVIELLSNRDYLKANFLKIHYLFTFLPIGIEIVAIYLNTKSPEIAIPFLLVNICIALLFIVDPFYKLTHVAFHVLLIAQNWYICFSNASA